MKKTKSLLISLNLSDPADELSADQMTVSVTTDSAAAWPEVGDPGEDCCGVHQVDEPYESA